jgi:probable nitrogen fixation protein
MTTLVIVEDDPILQTEFAKEMVKQLRALDTYDMYANWSDARILDPLILTKERKQEIPIVGDPSPIIISRVNAYYNALSCIIEAKCSLMAIPTVNLTHEGFGKVLINIGKLVVLNKPLRDVHRFGFKSLEKMHQEAEKIINTAVQLVERYREIAEL